MLPDDWMEVTIRDKNTHCMISTKIKSWQGAVELCFSALRACHYRLDFYNDQAIHVLEKVMNDNWNKARNEN